MFKNRVKLAPKVRAKIDIWQDYLFDNYRNREDLNYRVDMCRCLWRHLNQLSAASAVPALESGVYWTSVDDLFDVMYSLVISEADNLPFIYVKDIDFYF
jgi:hypothetical protein